MKSTRKVRSSRRKTLRQRGGKKKCPYGTPKEQIIRNIWNTTLHKLQNIYDQNYRGEFHVFTGSGVCNLWVWKKGETSQNDENHMDIYWYNYDTWELGITVTRHGKHVGKTQHYDMSYAKDYSQDNFAIEIAGAIDDVYNDFFY
jgi:hypothetical protein